MKEADRKTLQDALGIVVQTAVQTGVSLDELFGMLREIHTAAVQKTPAKPRREAGLGFFVVYVDPKKGPVTAHVTKVCEGDRRDLRLHLGAAQANPDVHDVPFSETFKPEHWSYRK